MNNLKLSKEMTGFCSPFISHLRAGVKEGLYLESPLRNEFQVRPCYDGELPFFRNMKKAYYIGENGVDVLEVVGGKKEYGSNPGDRTYLAYATAFDHCKRHKKMCVPFFEIAHNPEILFDADLKNKPAQDVLDFFIASVKKGFLEEETKLFKKLKRYLKKGKGIFCLRTDIEVLPAIEPENNRIGFSIFEQVGVAVFVGEKYKAI
jgi:hypothetical protein